MFIVGVTSLTYFSIWFYQVGLRELNTNESLYGYFRALLLVSEIILSFFIAKWLKKTKKKQVSVLFCTSLVALGFLIPGAGLGMIGVISMIVFGGGIGMKLSTVFSPFLNAQIESKNRATVLSFISLLRRSLLIILNLVFGYLIDVNFKVTFIIIGILILTIAIIWGPQEGDLADSK